MTLASPEPNPTALRQQPLHECRDLPGPVAIDRCAGGRVPGRGRGASALALSGAGPGARPTGGSTIAKRLLQHERQGISGAGGGPGPGAVPGPPLRDLAKAYVGVGDDGRLADVDLRRRIDAVLAHCQFVGGPEVAELERVLAEFCGAKHCIGISSGTDALQIAMMAEGIGPGDAVFLPAFTYTATAEVPLVLGATPVFVDIDPETFQIDIPHLRARIAAEHPLRKLKP
eukprot:gene57338-78559_t